LHTRTCLSCASAVRRPRVLTADDKATAADRRRELGGLLREARRLIARRGWENVTLLQQDASELALTEHPHAVLFSLSYSVMPRRPEALASAWRTLTPGGTVVIMDAGLPDNRLGRLLGPIGEAVATAFPGDPYSEPWVDLATLSEDVETERFQLGTYFICTADK
jgi:SAM-dependent methyltransferase